MFSEPHVRNVTITFNESPNKPKFDFTGVWTGRDVKVVRNLLWREYLWYTRDMRRQAIIPEKEEVPQ